MIDDYKDAEYIDVFRVDDEKGELVFVGRAKVESGKIKFETDHFSTYIC